MPIVDAYGRPYRTGGVAASLHANSGTEADRLGDAWGDPGARRFRYDLAWLLYQNTAYGELNRHAAEFRKAYGLYKAIRNVYNPVDRLVEFYASHVYGGAWDATAGDGSEVASAVPVVGDAATPALRAAVARLWRDSRWQAGVRRWVRWGGLFGDAPVKVGFDAERGRVCLDPVHPGEFAYVRFDRWGHVRAYVQERWEDDPREPARPDASRSAVPKRVLYRERCWRDGDLVWWETSLVDGTETPFDWTMTGADPAWSAPYGFVPLVWTRHIDAGAVGFGLSEYHTLLPKIVELDDQASKLNDQIRKVVEPKWAALGCSRPSSTPRIEAERDEEGMLYLREQGADLKPMVAPLQIADALENIRSLNDEVEKGRPVLRFDRLRAGGEISGEALRVARQPAERDVCERRLSYDADLVRLHQMALAIGGYHHAESGLESLAPYAGFGLDSYAAGELDHQVGMRPVFGDDPFEREALHLARYQSIAAAKAAGIPQRQALREAGYSDAQIDEMEAEAEAEAEKNAERMAAFREAAGFDNANPDDNGDQVPSGDFEDDDAA